MNRSKALFFSALFLAALVTGACSAGKETVPVEEYEKTENALKKRERDLQEKTIEMLDLKNQIIILQSEVADLKDNIIAMKSENDSLSYNLMEERNEAKVLTERLDEMDMDRLRLIQDNSALSRKVESNTDSLKTVLEIAARQNYEKNILQALSEEDTLSEPKEVHVPSAEEDLENTTARNLSAELNELSPVSPEDDGAVSEDEQTEQLGEKIETAITPLMKLTDAEYQQRYQEALDLYFSDDYNAAIKEFTALLEIDNTNEYSDNAQYWIAESHYSMGNFDQALTSFRKVLDFTDSNKLDHALFKSGLCNIKMNRKNAGLRDFQTLIEKYPQSELVSKVRDILESDSF